MVQMLNFLKSGACSGNRRAVRRLAKLQAARGSYYSRGLPKDWELLSLECLIPVHATPGEATSDIHHQSCNLVDTSLYMYSEKRHHTLVAVSTYISTFQLPDGSEGGFRLLNRFACVYHSS